MGKDLEFRLLQKSDEQGLSHLFREVFAVERDSRYWDWKYYRNPAGKHMVMVAIDKDRIVGCQGGIPVRIKVGTTTLCASEGVDIGVLEGNRNRGTIFKLDQGTREVCKRNNISFGYAFANEPSSRVFTRLLGAAAVCPIFSMTKLLNPTPYLYQKFRLKPLTKLLGLAGKQLIKITNSKRPSIPEGHKINELTEFDRRFDDFWHKEAENYEIAVVRNSRYLNWRYAESPEQYKIFSVENNESIRGFIVLQCLQGDFKRGRIVDLLVEAGQNRIIDLLLTKAMNYFFEQGVDVVTCWMFEHWPAFQGLKRRGFMMRKTNQVLLVRSYTHDLPNEYFKDKSKWYVTMGDSDYFG